MSNCVHSHSGKIAEYLAREAAREKAAITGVFSTPTSQWTLNFLRPSFWVQWTSRPKEERVIKAMLWDFAAPLFSHSPERTPANDHGDAGRDHSVAPGQLLLTDRLSSAFDLIVYEAPKKKSRQSISLDAEIAKPIPQSWMTSTPIADYSFHNLVADTPRYLCMPMNGPTPAHLAQISINGILGEAFDMNASDIDKRAESFKWTCIVCAVMFMVFMIGAMKWLGVFAVSFFVDYISTVGVIFPAAVSVLMAGFSFILYVFYLRLFWILKRDKFGTFSEFASDVKKNPWRALPLRIGYC